MWELVKAVYTDAISVLLAQRCLYVFIYLFFIFNELCDAGGKNETQVRQTFIVLFIWFYVFIWGHVFIGLS